MDLLGNKMKFELFKFFDIFWIFSELSLNIEKERIVIIIIEEVINTLFLIGLFPINVKKIIIPIRIGTETLATFWKYKPNKKLINRKFNMNTNIIVLLFLKL